MARYMELLKLAALIERRPRAEELPGAIAEINQVLAQAASPEQRELYLGLQPRRAAARRPSARALRRARAGRRARRDLARGLPADPRRRADAVGDRHRRLPDLPAALQVRARVRDPARADAPAALRDPRAPGARALPHAARQRGGARRQATLARAGADAADDAVRDGLAAARASATRTRSASSTRRRVAALERYHERFAGEEASPVWFERNFAFRIGPHLLRGRVDRVDRHPGRLVRADRLQDRPGAHAVAAEGRHPALALPARRARVVAARVLAAELLLRARRREGPARSPPRRTCSGSRRPRTEVADGILAQQFEPKPSYAACSICDFQLICPAAER